MAALDSKYRDHLEAQAGEGLKLLGKLGGGEAQRAGVQALGRWFEAGPD